ncbi:TROVE domain-containing protein [Corynebacterium kalidii]
MQKNPHRNHSDRADETVSGRASALLGYTTRQTPQDVPAPGRGDQVPNSAGGHVFEVTPESRLDRFLVLGSDGGSYYATAAGLTEDNARFILSDLQSRGRGVVDQIVAVSMAGRAPKNSPALFALALAASHGEADTRRYALGNLPKVARTASHLFEFLAYLDNHRGWGRQVRDAVASWYLDRDAEAIAYQAVKYRHRSGYTHKRVLDKAHVADAVGAHADVLRWARYGKARDGVPAVIRQFREVAQCPERAVEVISRDGCQLSWEMLPNEALSVPAVWRGLIEADRIPVTALIRQLTRLTRLGVFDDPEISRTVAGRVTDVDRLARGRVHPVSVLVALRTYASCEGAVPRIIDALNEAYMAAFGTLPGIDARVAHAVDVSGSMHGSPFRGGPLTAAEASAAMVCTGLKQNPDAHVWAFTGGQTEGGAWSRRSHIERFSGLSAGQRIDDAVDTLRSARWDGTATDAAAPILHALDNDIAVDTFIVYTDNETWAGEIHPYQALRRYREATGIDAKLVVMAMTSTGFTIADPEDAGMLDVVGFDAAVPTVVADFVSGR